MVWIAYGSAWLAVSMVSLACIRVSGNPFWGLLMIIPALISVKSENKVKDQGEEAEVPEE